MCQGSCSRFSGDVAGPVARAMLMPELWEQMSTKPPPGPTPLPLHNPPYPPYPAARLQVGLRPWLGGEGGALSQWGECWARGLHRIQTFPQEPWAGGAETPNSCHFVHFSLPLLFPTSATPAAH